MQYLSLRGKDKRIKGRDKWFERNDPVDSPLETLTNKGEINFPRKSEPREFRDSENPNPFLSKLKKNPIEFLPR